MLHNTLKSLRQSRKMSQKQLADLLFVSQQAVGKWERNEATPNPETILKIANIFDVSTDCLLGAEEKQPTTKNGSELSDEEQELLSLYRQLPEDRQDLVYEMIAAALRSQGLID